MAAVCFDPNTSCLTEAYPFCLVEAPFVSWNPILKQGYWCMPCCILEENNHSKMRVCSELSSPRDIRDQYNRHGRCGIEFNP